MAKQTKKNLLMQGSILAVAGLITRIIGLLYRIPMANMLGEEGNGIYSVAFGIYNITLTLSSYSLPLAVSKLISQRSVNKEYRNAFHIFRNALIFALIVGSIACSAIFFGADALEKVYATEGLAKPLRIVAPTTFVMAILGVFRGLFQGKNTMIPTAVSQILEQIVNAIVSLAAIYSFVHIYSASDQVAAYGAAGSMCGTLAGAFTALLFLLFVFVIYRPHLMNRLRSDKTRSDENNIEIYQILFLTIIPIIFSQTVYQIGYTLDDLIFGNIMTGKGYTNTIVSSLRGVFNSQYNLLINVPVAIASSMAASTIPSIAASAKSGSKDIKDKIKAVIKFNMVVAFPSAMGLSVLARPITQLLFPNLTTYQDTVVMLLVCGSSAVIFYSLSTITTSILQGMDYMRIPIYHAGISVIIHVLLVSGLLAFTNLGIYALLIGNITFPLLVCLLNWHSVEKYLQYKQEIRKTFGVPLLSSIIMGVIVFLVYHGLYLLLHSNLISVGISIPLGGAVYFMSLLLFKCFSLEELKDIPMGSRIARIGRRFL
ncbi:MAG: polysaccharide biosynthesis protein [Lachnospiraceae bacterium]|nr:polysaccharide biosynthesis protein [Lachnospiraceae bacterium]